MTQQCRLESIEAIRPEVLVVGDPAVGFGQRGGFDAAAMGAPHDRAFQEPGALEHLYVLGGGGEGHVEGLGEFTDAALSRRKAPQHRATGGVGQSVKHPVKTGFLEFNHMVEYIYSKQFIQPNS